MPTQQAVIHRRSGSLAGKDAGDLGVSAARKIVTYLRPLGLHGSPLNSDDALLVVETIGRKLSSLLISDDVSSNPLLRSRTVARSQTFGSFIYGSLILSVENNFAGLDRIRIGAVLKVFEKGPQMRSQLSKYLRALPNIVSKTLAENLIRAAIEDCDAPTVAELLNTGLVAPNDIVCLANGWRYTAVERSAMLGSFEVTKALLITGADINKTYERWPKLFWQGVLGLAVTNLHDRHSPVNMQLINMLLEHGAKVCMRTAALVVSFRNPDLIEAVTSNISPYDHPDSFCPDDLICHYIMEDAVRLLDSELATTVIARMVQACSKIGCSKCSKAYLDDLQKSMTLAAAKGHAGLVALFIDCILDKGPPLAGAVRSGKRDIIELLLEKGANPDAPDCVIEQDDRFFTTPFAEAIRAKDDELIRYFHGLGATTQISEKGRFGAAIYAASEAGKLIYVNELLQMAPGIDGETLGSALCISIKNGYEEIALTLLKAGADVSLQGSMYVGSLDPALIEALHQKNKTLILKIMECDVDVEVTTVQNTSPLVAAAQWGDVSIIKDLLSMGADINACTKSMDGTAITAAVRAKNRPLVEFLVEHGARLDLPRVSQRGSPLEAAISNEDIDMMQYLLDLGADLSCSRTINEAVEKGGEILAVVLKAVRIKFPMSKKGLGAEALQSAVEKNDVELTDVLLETKFDVNAIVETREIEVTSALGMAIGKLSQGNLYIIRKLIFAGGDPNSIVSKGGQFRGAVWPQRTALLQAILTKSKPLVELLIDEGADIKRAARLGLKRTPLQQACEIGAIEIIDLLLEKGVDVNEAPALRGGATSLQLCAIKGFCGIAEKLLKLGADVHALPSEVNGRTALDGAAENGRLDMLILLWNAAADKRFTAEQCSHAMKLAEENGHIACWDLIRHLDLTSRPFFEQGRVGT